MLLDHGTTHSLSSSKTNHMKEDVVCVKSSMMQKESIVVDQVRRRVDLSSSPKTQVATVVSPPHKQTQPLTTTATSNRKTPFDKKAVPGMKQIWVRKGEQPPALPLQIPSMHTNQARRRRKQLRQAPSQDIQQVWVPKKLAAAQQGQLQMWVPKKILHPQQPLFSHMQKVSTKRPKREKGKNHVQRPKEDQISSSTLVGRHAKRIWVWKPKVQVASTEPKHQPHWIPQFRKHPKRKTPEVTSTVPNDVLKWTPIRRITSVRDSMDTSTKAGINLHK
ncbi:hypothetical protein KP509_12G076300 [Ceratopteris richardii]|uniref:Uncharacterized protein n=1 Tax=Ceratopteris richardii TaxID=49495 RepID=A0A8T2TPY1_CERRI|nr:hypothetical protein KP509_12G076300 [Ceratopteris richardii]